MKNLHQIELSGYTAKTSEAAYLKLGTTDSYGIEQIQLVTDDAWRDLSITATFVTPESKTQVVVPESGLIDVPHEATAKPMTAESPGVLVFSGTGDGVRRISANLPYLVRDHAPVTGQETEPTPELYAQLIKQVSDASKAAYPRGGLKDQVLTKLSDAERDYAWKAPAGTGLPLIAEEDEGKVLSVVGQTAQWSTMLNIGDSAGSFPPLVNTVRFSEGDPVVELEVINDLTEYSRVFILAQVKPAPENTTQAKYRCTNTQNQALTAFDKTFTTKTAKQYVWICLIKTQISIMYMGPDNSGGLHNYSNTPNVAMCNFGVDVSRWTGALKLTTDDSSWNFGPGTEIYIFAD